MSNVIVRQDQISMVKSLAAYLPGGELFQAATIPGTTFNMLLLGLAVELQRAENYLFLYNDQFIPDRTTPFIPEWESAVGIPDECFVISPTDTDEERRLNIITKLASLGVQTADDFINLAANYGITVTVIPLSETIDPPYDVPFTPFSSVEARFTWIIKGDNLFTEEILLCLFCKLKPANTKLIFEDPNVTIELPAYDVPFGPTGNFIEC